MIQKHATMTKKEFLIDYLLSIALELVILFGLMGFCALFIYRGDLVGEAESVGYEMSSPTSGRLIYLFLSFAVSVILCIAASKQAKSKKDVSAFWLGYTSGILLWQALGEEAWHFSVGGLHFVQLESVSAFPIVILFVALILYSGRRRVFDWGIWCMTISFACNWLGHYVTIGLYPFVKNLFASRSWNVCVGSIGGAVMFIVSIIYLIRRGDTKKGRMFASMLTYISIGITALSMIDG